MHRLAIAILCAGCSGESTSPGTPDARLTTPADAEVIDPTVLRVAGEYDTAVTLMDSTCSGIAVMNNPTTVTHTAGATMLTLGHAGQSYPGSIQRNGEFATTAVPVELPAETHTILITGDFSATGFTATVAVQVSSGGSVRCGYTVRWIGTRGSGMNVIPE
jgi:hypothetical protein